MIGVGVISDRGDLYLPGCLESLNQHSDMAAWIIDDRDHRLGMAGAVQKSWRLALDYGCDYLLHVEEDFRFHGLPLDDMRMLLDYHPTLAQVALKRQPWSSEEKQAGGLVELRADQYADQETNGVDWLRQTWLFTLNPCLIPRRTLELGVPVGHPKGFEAAFTAQCLTAGYSFALYGARTDEPLIEHVGHQRGGQGWAW